MEAVRRRFLTEEGEALLLCHSAIDVLNRYDRWIRDSGIQPGDVASSHIVAVPLPRYSTIEPGHRRWKGAKPSIMWHPLMWLPPRLANRTSVIAADGTELVEPEYLWQIRVCLELTASGLYDPQSGTWLDILSTIGMDVTDAETRQRIQDWLDGNDDDGLDAIDLSFHLDLPDIDWGMSLALDIHTEVNNAAWALMANDLLSIADIISSGQTSSIDDARNTIDTVLLLGREIFAGVPSSNPGDNSRFWDSVEQRANTATTPEGLVKSCVQPLETYLTRIRDAYWPSYENIPALLGAGIDDDDEPDFTPPHRPE